MSDNQEERREREFQQIRAKHQRLSEMILQGTRFHETVTVRCTDGQEHQVDVHAISDNQIRIAFEEAGVEVRDLQNANALFDNLTLPRKMKLFASVSAAATDDAKISDVLLPLQTAPIALKAFELSGFGSGPKAASTSSSKASTPPP